MTPYIARILLLVDDRQDWSQPRLKYLPGSLYGDRIGLRGWLRRLRARRRA